jgi:hypothetical protein
LKEAWTDLLFQIPGFEEALFKMVSAMRAYDKLRVSGGKKYIKVY